MRTLANADRYRRDHDPSRCRDRAASNPNAVSVIEFYNSSLDHYFITWVPDEIAKLDQGTVIKGWVRTGQSLRTFNTPQSGTSPVCRFYIPPELGDSHFFGRGTAECNATGQKNPSFILEDPAFMQMFLPVGPSARGARPRSIASSATVRMPITAT